VSGFQPRPGKEVLNRAVLMPETAGIKKSARGAVALLLANSPAGDAGILKPYPKYPPKLTVGMRLTPHTGRKRGTQG